jgi:hypothetical protein
MWLKVLKRADTHSVVQIIGKPAIMKAMIPNLPPPGYVFEVDSVRFDLLSSQLQAKHTSGDTSGKFEVPRPKRPKLASTDGV